MDTRAQGKIYFKKMIQQTIRSCSLPEYNMLKFMKKIGKICIYILGWILIILLSIAIFSYYNYSRGYTSVTDIERGSLFSDMTQDSIILTDTPTSRRTGNTFMSVPEWYIVSISSDYTLWLESGKNPSDFPYWQYLVDYWVIYGKITALMDGTIPRDSEYHTMVQVIWVSTTLELGLKSIYENTIWRLTSLFSYNTPEDQYFTSISRKYVDFILLRPWYEFDYGSALAWLSQELPHSDNPSLIRSTERRIIIGWEFFLKKQYAKIIENATKWAFAIPDINTTIQGDLPANLWTIDTRIRSLSGQITVPRYYPFTEIVPKILSDTGVKIDTIAGNHKVVISTVSDTSYTHDDIWLSIANPIDASKKRVFYYSQIPEMTQIIQDSHTSLEHIYDF